MQKTCRIVLAVFLLGFFLTVSVSGQGSEKKGWGYGFFVGGFATDGSESEGIVHMGGGVDLLLAGGLGVGLEIGSLSWGGISDGVGVFSPGVIYAFNTDQKTIPFITGGYTLFFREGSANGAFFGVAGTGTRSAENLSNNNQPITSKANTDNFPAERARIILGSSIRNNEASEFSILLADIGGYH